MTRIVLDANIHGLQVHGGVSGYVARLYAEFTRMGATPLLLQPQARIYRGFGAAMLDVAPAASRERLPAKIAQYLPARGAQRDTAFLSAYYRRPARRVARHVVTVHDFTYERFRSGAALWLHHRTKTAAIRAADAVICISEATRRDTLEFCPEVDPARIRVIPHGVDLATFHPDATGAPESMADTVLYVGQRVAYKRFDLAIEAVARQPALRLGFVGPAPSPEEVALLDRYITGRWTWLGQVDDATLRALYASAYAFLFPSDYEGFGLPVLEAMACGCPVIISPDAALREVGADAAVSVREQAPDAYAAALDSVGDPDTRAAMIAQGHLLAARATWQACARRTLDVLTGH